MMQLLSLILGAICWCMPTSLEMGAEGKLFLAYDAREEHSPACIEIISSSDEGGSWSQPVRFSDASDTLSGAVLWRGLQGELRIVYSRTAPEGTPVLEQRVLLEGGWSEPARIGEGRVSSKPVVLRSGMMLLAVQKPDGTVGTLVSRDRGAGWMPLPGVVTLDEKIRDAHNMPVLVPNRSGRLTLYTSAHGRQWRWKSVSQNFGGSWSTPEPSYCCPFTFSSISVLPNGKWLMVKNGKLDQRLFYLPDRLYAYLSDDEGATWYGGMRIDSRMDALNPVSCAPGGGSIYIAWAYAPEDGHASAIHFLKTSEAEIARSTLVSAKEPQGTSIAVNASKEAGRIYSEWYRSVTSSKGSWAKEPIRVCSYNIELKSGKAGVPPWEERLRYVDWLFRKYDFDVVGVQEPWAPEYGDLVRTLGDRWESITACVSPDRANFQNSIFWKRDRVEKLDDGVFFYGEFHGDMSGFGGSSPRLCIWAKFRDRKTGKIFYNFNSHFDFISREAGILSSRLLMRKVREIAGEYPAFLTGDYNCSDDNPAMLLLSGCGWLADSKVKAERAENAAYSTVRSYREVVPKGPPQLDHIYFTTGKSKVKSWKLIMDEHDGLRGGSDHMPIYIDWILSN